MRRILRVPILSLAAVLLVSGEASAQLAGTLTPADPTMTLVTIDEPHCGVQSGIAVHYDVHSLPLNQSRIATVSLSSPSDRAAFYVYRGAFNPSNGTVNCLGAANLGSPKRLTMFLDGGLTYHIVVFNNTENQSLAAIDYVLNVIFPLHPEVDFTGDGASDLPVVRNEGGARWWVANTANSGFFQRLWGFASDIVMPVDYGMTTNDGVADLALWRPGPPGTAGFWIIDSVVGQPYFLAFGQSGDDPRVAGDYQANIGTRPSIYRPGAAPGLLSTWIYREFSGSITSVFWGQHGDTPVTGNYDGDWVSDFVVRRNAGGAALYLMKLSSGGISGGVAAIYFGVAADLTVPGDYDGDGKTDLAIARDAAGALQWWIKRSSDGAIVSQIFGMSTDLPVPGDYDRDGKTDIAVWRAGFPGTFWISKSTGGVLTRFWGQTGDYPAANWVVR